MTEPIRTVIDVAEENELSIIEELKSVSAENESVLLALIAPYVGKKITPSKTVSAQVGLSEEFGVETVIHEIKDKTDVKKLMLLVNSPGGFIASAYKCARALRKNFDEIISFVPHIAASGGTLLVITGNTIVMGMMSHLSPMDPLSEDSSGRTVSADAVVDSHKFVTSFFRRTAVEDVPYTYKVLADKFDAIEIHDALSAISLMEDYVAEILSDTGYTDQEVKEISENLVEGYKLHSEVINADKAQDLGLKVHRDDQYPREWKAIRQWLGVHMLTSADKHVIRYVVADSLRKDISSAIGNETESVEN